MKIQFLIYQKYFSRTLLTRLMTKYYRTKTEHMQLIFLKKKPYFLLGTKKNFKVLLYFTILQTFAHLPSTRQPCKKLQILTILTTALQTKTKIIEFQNPIPKLCNTNL